MYFRKCSGCSCYSAVRKSTLISCSRQNCLMISSRRTEGRLASRNVVHGALSKVVPYTTIFVIQCRSRLLVFGQNKRKNHCFHCFPIITSFKLAYSKIKYYYPNPERVIYPGVGIIQWFWKEKFWWPIKLDDGDIPLIARDRCSDRVQPSKTTVWHPHHWIDRLHWSRIVAIVFRRMLWKTAKMAAFCSKNQKRGRYCRRTRRTESGA